MGARGANIQKVCSDFNVQIKIPDRKSSKAQPNGITNGQDEDTNGHDNSDIIRISGRKENCEDAAAALNALVPINIEVTLIEYPLDRSFVEGEMTKASFELYCCLLILPLQVEVPFEFHRFIIGRGGENVRKLMNHHDVNIKVPSSDQQSSIIVVTGPKAHVQSAETGTVKS